MSLLILVAFVVFGAIGVPIAISLIMTAITYFVATGDAFYIQIIPQRMFGGISSFELLAIPMFILSGDLLFEGGVSKSLVQLANSLVGHVRGGMSIVTTLACMFFGAVSGSGPATAAAIGAVVAPEMEKSGYDKAFTGAVITASGPLGILIPPSILMVVYGVVTGTSIGALLMAGIGPGIVYGVFLMSYEWYICRKRGYGANAEPFSVAGVVKAVKNAVWALLIPVIILGGIYSGFFTPTEAAGVAVVYALFVAMVVLKTIAFNKNLFNILLNSSMTTATVMFVVAGVACISWVLTREQIPEMLAEIALSNVSSPLMFMLICNVILFFAGMIENGSACILLLTPLMFPISEQYGIDPVYFGAITVANLAIGMMTPPVATTLYVAAKVTKVPLSKLVPEVIPFCFVLLAALCTLMAFPAITLTLPRMVFGSW